MRFSCDYNFLLNIVKMFCKNDPKSKYKGTEPSPKGLGWCAHAEKIGTIKKGKDKNNWIVEENSNGVKRWVKCKMTMEDAYVICDNTSNKIRKWYTILSTGGYLLVYKDKVKMIDSKKKTDKARMRELVEKYNKGVLDPNVLKIVWAPMSQDSYDNFVKYFIITMPSPIVKKFIKNPSLKLIAPHINKLIEPYELSSKKDYLFKGSNIVDTDKKLLKKLKSL